MQHRGLFVCVGLQARRHAVAHACLPLSLVAEQTPVVCFCCWSACAWACLLLHSLAGTYAAGVLAVFTLSPFQRACLSRALLYRGDVFLFLSFQRAACKRAQPVLQTCYLRGTAELYPRAPDCWALQCLQGVQLMHVQRQEALSLGGPVLAHALLIPFVCVEHMVTALLDSVLCEFVNGCVCMPPSSRPATSVLSMTSSQQHHAHRHTFVRLAVMWQKKCGSPCSGRPPHSRMG